MFSDIEAVRASGWEGHTVFLVLATLPNLSLKCCLALSAFVGLKLHTVIKVKAVVLAFSILRKENGLFLAICGVFFRLEKT